MFDLQVDGVVVDLQRSCTSGSKTVLLKHLEQSKGTMTEHDCGLHEKTRTLIGLSEASMPLSGTMYGYKMANLSKNNVFSHSKLKWIEDHNLDPVELQDSTSGT